MSSELEEPDPPGEVPTTGKAKKKPRKKKTSSGLTPRVGDAVTTDETTPTTEATTTGEVTPADPGASGEPGATLTEDGVVPRAMSKRKKKKEKVEGSEDPPTSQSDLDPTEESATPRKRKKRRASESGSVAPPPAPGEATPAPEGVGGGDLPEGEEGPATTEGTVTGTKKKRKKKKETTPGDSGEIGGSTEALEAPPAPEAGDATSPPTESVDVGEEATPSPPVDTGAPVEEVAPLPPPNQAEPGTPETPADPPPPIGVPPNQLDAVPVEEVGQNTAYLHQRIVELTASLESAQSIVEEQKRAETTLWDQWQGTLPDHLPPDERVQRIAAIEGVLRRRVEEISTREALVGHQETENAGLQSDLEALKESLEHREAELAARADAYFQRRQAEVDALKEATLARRRAVEERELATERREELLKAAHFEMKGKLEQLTTQEDELSARRAEVEAAVEDVRQREVQLAQRERTLQEEETKLADKRAEGTAQEAAWKEMQRRAEIQTRWLRAKELDLVKVEMGTYHAAGPAAPVVTPEVEWLQSDVMAARREVENRLATIADHEKEVERKEKRLAALMREAEWQLKEGNLRTSEVERRELLLRGSEREHTLRAHRVGQLETHLEDAEKDIQIRKGALRSVEAEIDEQRRRVDRRARYIDGVQERIQWKRAMSSAVLRDVMTPPPSGTVAVGAALRQRPDMGDLYTTMDELPPPMVGGVAWPPAEQS